MMNDDFKRSELNFELVHVESERSQHWREQPLQCMAIITRAWLLAEICAQPSSTPLQLNSVIQLLSQTRLESFDRLQGGKGSAATVPYFYFHTAVCLDVVLVKGTWCTPLP